MSRFDIHDELTAPEGRSPSSRARSHQQASCRTSSGSSPARRPPCAATPLSRRAAPRVAGARHARADRARRRRALRLQARPASTRHRTPAPASASTRSRWPASGTPATERVGAAALPAPLVSEAAARRMHLHEEAREAGWTDEQILEAIACVALESFTALVNVAGEVPVDGSAEETRSCAPRLDDARVTSRTMVDARSSRGGRRLLSHYHEAIELIGKRWSGAILSCCSIGRACASSRSPARSPTFRPPALRARQGARGARGRSSAGQRPAVRVEYALTERGPSSAALAELKRWARRWLARPSSRQGSRKPRPSRSAPADTPKTADDVQAIVEDRNIRFVRPVVHRHPRPAEVLLDQPRGARRRVRGRMGFDGSSITGFNAIEESDMIAMPDPRTFAVLPGARGPGRRADVLRHPHPRAQPYEGDPRHVLRRALERRDRWASTASTSAPSSSTSSSATPRPRAAGRGRLLRPDHAGRRLRPASRDGARARAARHPRRVLPPRGRPIDQHEIDMRYADGAEDGRRRDLPHHGQGVRHQVRDGTRPSCPSRCSARTARACIRTSPCSRATQRVLRRGRPVLPLRRGQGVHRRPALHAREICSIFAQWVNSYKRLVPGFEAPVYVRLEPAQPLGPRARAAVPPRQGEGDAMELRCPDPACNPYLTFAVLPRRAWRASRRATSCPSRWRRTCTTCRPRTGSGPGIEQLPETLGEAID